MARKKKKGKSKTQTTLQNANLDRNEAPRRRNVHRNQPTATRPERKINMAPPQVVTEISFEDCLVSIRETGIYPMPQRGSDGYYAIRRYQALKPTYLPVYQEKQVTKAIQDGADIVVCTRDRQIIISPGTPFTLDRPVMSCGCNPKGKCHCMRIMMGIFSDEQITQDLSDHHNATHCSGESPTTTDEQDLYQLTERNHEWWDGEETPPMVETVIEYGPHQISKTLEVCRNCKKLRATTSLVPMDFVSKRTVLDAVIMDTEKETIAAWLHNQTENRMVPCTEDQYSFATSKIEERLDNYPLI